MPGQNTMVSSNESDLKRFYKCPPYFLVAFESQLKLPSILKRIEDLMKSQGFGVNEINRVLDAIFILDQGWVVNFGDGKGSFQVLKYANYLLNPEIFIIGFKIFLPCFHR